MKKLVWNRHTKLLIKLVAGWLCIALGIVMLISPGQGILTILIGVFLLADHVPVFGKFKAWLQHRFPKTADFVHHAGERLHAKFHKKKSPGDQ